MIKNKLKRRIKKVEINITNQQGITLMILVVTIIVLLILAGVAINLSMKDGGVLSETKEAVNNWKKATEEEEGELSKLASQMQKLRNETHSENSGNNEENPKDDNINPLKEITVNETKNIQTTDKNRNKIVIPAGFKVLNPEEDVTKGIIIEDVIANNATSKGNQYVWIPVSHVDDEKANTIKDSNGIEHTIYLGRYDFGSNGSISEFSGNHKEETAEEHVISKFGNTIAKDINAFKESVKNNGGYYIARYEAGDPTATNDRVDGSSQSTTPVFKENKIAYNSIYQTNAATLMRNLYSNQNEKYTSDLINSYSWDTAIVFIQEFSGDKEYSKQNKLQYSLAKTGQSSDGTNKDVRCNIYDMAGNVSEWSTEGYTKDNPFISRGGNYLNINWPCFRLASNITTSKESFKRIGFRRNYIFVKN